MSLKETKTTITLTPSELEDLIRRVLREELTRLVHLSPCRLLDDWEQEGPEDAVGDSSLLAEALAVLEDYGHSVEAWANWKDFEAELGGES
ncbi:MAG: hypothetical protein ACUVWR_10250 [Anaerolineae bacterium]